jgi:predicted regulator of Ras-like GTPase activity (Roadblock/LC7/MglB family)
MHWLADGIGALHQLADRHLRVRQLGAPDLERKAREELMNAVHDLVTTAGAKEGVIGCFAAYEGLLISTAGDTDFEAQAATTQGFLWHAFDNSETLALGPIKQMVIVGENSKVALIPIGVITIGIMGPTATNLSELLAT